jgi:hypothetical protein
MNSERSLLPPRKPGSRSQLPGRRVPRARVAKAASSAAARQEGLLLQVMLRQPNLHLLQSRRQLQKKRLLRVLPRMQAVRLLKLRGSRSRLLATLFTQAVAVGGSSCRSRSAASMGCSLGSCG